ncbi:hypothetical protein [Acidianus brierleyi]|uniref:Uncharacterized protein n=1 Tax=Acidianus brierleyi TaxID=41673 RepID=A0A2U9IF84_9CREN|nr:hypothetical protein [Acidianus brierleyi]AWR94669.1 hypothetical protein DFR85_08730 [Acidianus brierleyi]
MAMGFENTKEQLKVKTEIRCMTCDYKIVRDFQQGDFVPKIVGQCPKDGGQLYIAGIYAENIAPAQKK